MKNSKFLSVILNLVVIAILLGGALFIGDTLSRTTLSSEDSSALYGGRLETGYPSAGFMLSYDGLNLVDLCGIVLISPSTAVSAAHCFDKGTEFYQGINEFKSEKTSLTAVSAFKQKQGWDRRTSTNDFAVATLSRTPPLALGEYAQVTTPKVGCNYVVVAYGRNETEINAGGLTMERPRKSADVCITSMDANVFYINSSDGGICNGDSGSPIYEKNSNRFVGVVSAIIRPQDGSPACFVGNTAIVNRADNNLNFIQGLPDNSGNIISNLIQPIPGESISSNTVDIFSQVAAGQFNVGRLPRNQQFMLLSLAIMMILIFGYVFVRNLRSGRVETKAFPSVGVSPLSKSIVAGSQNMPKPTADSQSSTVVASQPLSPISSNSETVIGTTQPQSRLGNILPGQKSPSKPFTQQVQPDPVRTVYNMQQPQKGKTQPTSSAQITDNKSESQSATSQPAAIQLQSNTVATSPTQRLVVPKPYPVLDRKTPLPPLE